MKQNSLFAALLIFSLALGCATQPKWTQHELVFGLTSNAGKTRITDQEWERFRDEHIVSRFPKGFTLYNTQGYWQSSKKTYTEPSIVLMIVTSDGENSAKKLNDIAYAYKQQFNQESVLHIQSPVKVNFNDGDNSEISSSVFTK